MASPLVRKPKSPSDADPAPPSTQVYHWPAHFSRLSWSVPLVGGLLLAEGAWFLLTSTSAEDLPRMTAGFLLVIVASLALVGVITMHACLAREARFTRDRLIIRQTGRADLTLAYSAYENDWIADVTGSGAVRILHYDRNRGCTIPEAPQWVLDALREIARIQREEGWYQPDPA